MKMRHLVACTELNCVCEIIGLMFAYLFQNLYLLLLWLFWRSCMWVGGNYEIHKIKDEGSFS